MAVWSFAIKEANRERKEIPAHSGFLNSYWADIGVCFLPSQGPPGASRFWERPGDSPPEMSEGERPADSLISDFQLLELPFSRENTFLLFEVTQL